MEGDLRALRSALAEYVDGIEEVDPDDRALLATADGLRQALEAVYGQRITFKGEDRPVTGPVVEGAVDVDQVVGLVAGVRARYVTGGHVRGSVRADRVDGQAFGVDVESVGD